MNEVNKKVSQIQREDQRDERRGPWVSALRRASGWLGGLETMADPPVFPNPSVILTPPLA